MPAGFCTNDVYFSVNQSTLLILLSIILPDFRLKTKIVPLHVSFNEVRDRSDDAREQTDVYPVLSGRWNVESKLLVELVEASHFGIDTRWRRDDHVNSLPNSAFLAHLWDEDLCGLGVPVACSCGLLSHSHIGGNGSAGLRSSAPTGSHLGFVFIHL